MDHMLYGGMIVAQPHFVTECCSSVSRSGLCSACKLLGNKMSGLFVGDL